MPAAEAAAAGRGEGGAVDGVAGALDRDAHAEARKRRATTEVRRRCVMGLSRNHARLRSAPAEGSGYRPSPLQLSVTCTGADAVDDFGFFTITSRVPSGCGSKLRPMPPK